MPPVRSYPISITAARIVDEAENELVKATKAVEEFKSEFQKREIISTNDFGTDTAEFPCFRKLPLETRLIIWRLAFPCPKPFNLNFLFDFRDNTHLIDSHMKRKEWDALHNAQLPITLQINQESRAETLKHYAIIFGRKLKTLDCPDYSYQPLCLNPRRDQVYINWSALQNGTIFVLALILELKAEYPRCFNAITSVDIRDYWWNGDINDAMSYPWATEDLMVRHSLDEINSHPSMLCGGALRLLPDLKEVYLTKCRLEAERGSHNRWKLKIIPEEKQDARGINEAKAHVDRVLELGKGEFLSGKAPKVVIREWKCLPGIEIP